MNVLAGLECEPAVLEVEADRRGDRDRVDVVVGEELFDRGVHGRDAELGCRRLGALLHRVAERLNADPVARRPAA